ncbi:MAG: anthranilate synthase component I [Gammaproteobacteria bacterium]|nr:anthranilate synthase component I [Gammaproteobacteria bacterium]
MIDRQQFDEYKAEGYNRIPVVREVLADLDTPVSTYLKLAGQPYSYLFESVEGGEKWGRYSIIGLPCSTRIRVTGDNFRIEAGEKVILEKTTSDPLAEIAKLARQFRVPEVPGVPRFSGGLVGYFGYDTVRYIEPHLGVPNKPDPIGAPDILLMLSEEVVVFDNLRGRLYVIVHADTENDDAFDRAAGRAGEIVEALAGPVPEPAAGGGAAVDESEFVSSFSKERFEDAVRRSREYIENGDIFQVVLSQRLSVPFAARPLDLYRALRTVNPSPYMYYLDLDGLHVVGSSPEILVRLEDGEVTVRPIAGTRRRGHDDAEDAHLAEELMSDPKELAEHLMLVDLGRNDVGRVAKIGTVRLTEKMQVERYSHVMHIVSNVCGELDPSLDASDVLKACFPAGTVSGAPKVRAMEIIDEFEPEKRGVYSGAVGYIGWHGNMDTAIAIRTAVIKDGTLYIQAGAGIVADSVPSLEWAETMSKARAVFKAVSMACKGLDGARIEF